MPPATQIDIVLKDEVTGQAKLVHASLKRLKDDAKKATPIGKRALEALESTIEAVGRELKASATVLGASSVVFSGSFVTALANIAGSLDRFAENAIKQHAVGREVGLTYEQFERLVIAAKARGVSDKDARAQVEKLARSVRDLSLGNRSATRDRLEEGGFRDTGTIISKEFQASLQRNGLYNTILEVLGKMQDKAGQGQEGRWAAQVLGESMGLSGAAWNDIKDMLEKIKHIVIPSEEASKKYKLASRKLEISLNKLRSRITAALVPSMTKLLKMLGDFFNEKNTERFMNWLRRVFKALVEFPWDKLRERIDGVLSLVGNELVNFTEHLADFIADIDNFLQIINRWREGNRGRTGDAMQPALIVLPEVEVDENDQQPDASTPQKFSYGGPLPFTTNPASDAKFDMSGILTAANAKIGAAKIIDLRKPGYGSYSEEALTNSVDEKLTEQVNKLAFEMRRLVDVLRDLRGGAGGGSSDGGVSKKARTRPADTKAGSAGGAPKTPQQQTEDQRQAAANPISRGAVSGGPAPVGPRTVKGSWFGNYSKQLGSTIGWDDPDDKYTSGPKKGQPKPNYAGYGQDVPGIAIPYRRAAGPAEKQQGMPVRVWDPRTGRPSVLGRVVDIGPNQINPRSKDKGLDMNAAMAERLGYAPTKKTAQDTGRDQFPTGAQFKYQVLRTEDMLRARTEMDQERKRIAGTAIKWHRQAQVDLNVNVNGPKGVKVDADVDGGDSVDSTTNINRNDGATSIKSSKREQAQEALRDVHRSLREQEEGRDPRRVQRALENVQPGSDEEWELRKQRALKEAGPGYSERQEAQPPEGYGPGSGLPEAGEILKREKRMEKQLEDYKGYYDRDWRGSATEDKYGKPGEFYNPRTGAPQGEPI